MTLRSTPSLGKGKLGSGFGSADLVHAVTDAISKRSGLSADTEAIIQCTSHSGGVHEDAIDTARSTRT